jgi:uncharacterized membrane protein YeaQ/YmgE (transglycosylase-associated protein family)
MNILFGGELVMNLILWIIFGAIVGWIASLVMKTDSSQGILWDIIMGVVGAAVGGLLMGLIGQAGITGFNLYSFIVAIIGAITVIYVGRILRFK